MNLIVAVDDNWGIGKNGDLLTSIPEDMEFFKTTTKNAILIMGYNTLLSFKNGRPLPGRLNIVIADIKDKRIDKTLTCNSLDELFSLIKTFRSSDVFVIGGGYTYRQLLPYCDTAYITKMRKTWDADTFFDDLDQSGSWHIESESEMHAWEGLEFSFVKYINKNPESTSFTGNDPDMSSYFKKKKTAEIRYLTIDDEKIRQLYENELKQLLSAYFHPLSSGLCYSDLNGKYDVSLERYLKENRYIADMSSFDELYDRYRSYSSSENIKQISPEDL